MSNTPFVLCQFKFQVGLPCIIRLDRIEAVWQRVTGQVVVRTFSGHEFDVDGTYEDVLNEIQLAAAISNVSYAEQQEMIDDE